MSVKECENSRKMDVKRDKVFYEDALTETGWGKFNGLMLTMCCGIVAAMVFELYSVSYVVPASACELATTSEQQGLMAALPLIGVIATSHLWGYLADKRGRRKMLCFSMILGFIAGSLATLSPNWVVLCFFKFLSSAAVSGASALALTLLGECTPAKQRSTVLLTMTSVFMACIGIMAVITIPVLPLSFSFFIPGLNIFFNSWRLLNLIFSFPCALAALGAVYSCESPKYLLSIGNEVKTMDALRMIYGMNSGKSKDEYQINSVVLGEETGATSREGFIKSVISQTLPMLKYPLLKGTLLLSVLFFIVFLCANSFVVWLPLILDAFMSSVESGATGLTICQMIRLAQNTSLNIEEHDSCTMNSTAMTLILSMCLVLAFSNLIVGFIQHYIGKRRIYLFLQFTCASAAFCINFSPYWILSAVLFLIVMFEMINFGILTSFIIDIYPTYLKATVVCLMLMMARSSAILGINVLKRLLDNNCEFAFYIFGILSVFTGLLGLLLPADRPITKIMEK